MSTEVHENLYHSPDWIDILGLVENVNIICNVGP
jgi:hypothetical protein